MGEFFQELWLEWPALLSGIHWTIVLSFTSTISGLLGGMFLLFSCPIPPPRFAPSPMPTPPFSFFRSYFFAAIIYLILVILLSIATRKIQRRTHIPGFP